MNPAFKIPFVNQNHAPLSLRSSPWCGKTKLTKRKIIGLLWLWYLKNRTFDSGTQRIQLDFFHNWEYLIEQIIVSGSRIIQKIAFSYWSTFFRGCLNTVFPDMKWSCDFCIQGASIGITRLNTHTLFTGIYFYAVCKYRSYNLLILKSALFILLK